MTKLIRKKIVMLGAFGVGKSSLVRRFVSNEFSEEYLSTLGVRIEKRCVELETANIELLVWDIAGDDEFVRLRSSYLRGASGVFMVADSTRAWTIDKVTELRASFDEELKLVPCRILVNKCDLDSDQALDGCLRDQGFGDVVRTSAKSANNVESVFTEMAREVSRTCTPTSPN